MLIISPSADNKPLTSPQVLILWLHFQRLGPPLLVGCRPRAGSALVNLKLCFKWSLE